MKQQKVSLADQCADIGWSLSSAIVRWVSSTFQSVKKTGHQGRGM